MKKKNNKKISILIRASLNDFASWKYGNSRSDYQIMNREVARYGEAV